MAKTLSKEKIEALQSLLDSNPDKARKRIQRWKKMGIDTSQLDDHWSPISEVTGFLGGVPTGASYGLVDPGLGESAYHFPEDVPVVGGESPSKLLGEVLGGAFTGGALFKQGAKFVGKPAAKKVVEKMGHKGPLAKVARRGAFYGGAATPEAVVGATFAAMKEGSFEDFGENLALWQGIGMAATPLGRKLSKLWFRYKKAKTPEVKEQIAEEIKLLPEHTETDFYGTPEGDIVPAYLNLSKDDVDFWSTPEGMIKAGEVEDLYRTTRQRVNEIQGRLESRTMGLDEKGVLQEELLLKQAQEDELAAIISRQKRPVEQRSRARGSGFREEGLPQEGAPPPEFDQPPQTRPIPGIVHPVTKRTVAPPDMGEEVPLSVREQQAKDIYDPDADPFTKPKKAPKLREREKQIKKTQQDMRFTAEGIGAPEPTKAEFSRGPGQQAIRLEAQEIELSDLIRRHESLSWEIDSGTAAEGTEGAVADLARQIDGIRSKGHVGPEPDETVDFYKGYWVTDGMKTAEISKKMDSFRINWANMSRDWNDAKGIHPYNRGKGSIHKLTKRAFDTVENYARFRMELERQKKLNPKKAWTKLQDSDSKLSYNDAMISRALKYYRKVNNTAAPDRSAVVPNAAQKMRDKAQSAKVEKVPESIKTDEEIAKDVEAFLELKRELKVGKKIPELDPEEEILERQYGERTYWSVEPTMRDPMTGDPIPSSLEYAYTADQARDQWIAKWEKTRAPLPNVPEKSPNQEAAMAESLERLGFKAKIQTGEELEPSPEWKGELYHGTTNINLQEMIDPETGVLTLKPFSNFGGKTSGISLSSNYEEAMDYASRVKNPMAEGSPQVGSMRDSSQPVIAIKKSAIPEGVTRETDTEWSLPGRFMINEGDYRIVYQKDEWLEEIEKADFEDLARAYIRNTTEGEMAEMGGSAGGADYALTHDISRGPQLEEMVQKRIQQDPKNYETWVRISSDPKSGAPYDMSDWFEKPADAAITPVSVKNLKGVGAVKAAEKKGEGVNVLRKRGHQHYGNPFKLKVAASKATAKQVQDVVDKYRNWLNNDPRYADVNPEQREWINQQIQAGALNNKTLLYYTDVHAKRGLQSHADVLADFANRKVGTAPPEENPYNFVVEQALDRDIERLDPGRSIEKDFKKYRKASFESRMESMDKARTEDRIDDLAPSGQHGFHEDKVFDDRMDRIDTFRKEFQDKYRKGKTMADVLGKAQTKSQRKQIAQRISRATTLREIEELLEPEELKYLAGNDWIKTRSEIIAKRAELVLKDPTPPMQREMAEKKAMQEAKGNKFWNLTQKGDQVTLTTRGLYSKKGILSEQEGSRYRETTEEVEIDPNIPEWQNVGGYTERRTTRTPDPQKIMTGQTRKGRNSVSGTVESITEKTISLRTREGVRRYTKKKWYVSGAPTLKARQPVQGGALSKGEMSLATEGQMERVAGLMSDIHELRIDVSPRSMIADDMTERQARDLILRLEELKELAEAERFVQMSDELDYVNREGYLYDTPRHNYEAPHEWQAWVDNLPDEDKNVDVSRLYSLLDGRAGIGSPHGRTFGMGRNKMTHAGVKHSMRKIEEKQAKLVEWQGRYNEIRQLMGVPNPIKSAPEIIMGRMGRTGSSYDQAKTNLYKLAEIIQTSDGLSDDQLNFLKQGKNREAYEKYRSLMNDIAGDIGLGPNRRISHYLHIIYKNKPGEWRLRLVQDRLNQKDRDLIERYVDGLGDDTDALLNEYIAKLNKKDYRLSGKGFRAVKTRQSPDSKAVEQDLDLVTDSYIHGAAEYWFTREVGDVNTFILNELRGMTKDSPHSNIKNAYAQWMSHLYGQPTNDRQHFATTTMNKMLFNNATDHLIGYIGAGETSDFVNAMRKARDPNNPDFTDAWNILDQWEELTRARHPLTGELQFPLKEHGSDYVRTLVAKQLNDMREALADPNRSGPLATQLYRIQVVAKLGFNFAHGLINTLQTYTNVWPLVGREHLSDAFVDYVWGRNSNEKTVYGMGVKDLLDRSGVRADASRYTEYTDLRPGQAMEVIQSFAMKPSSATEDFNRGLAYLAGYRKFRGEGMDDSVAHIKALDFVQETHHPFNRAGTPPIMRGPLLRLLLMFKSYPIHQTEFTLGMMKDSYRAIKDKTFRRAVKDGDLDALTKHLFAYLTLYGSALTVFANSNFYERVKHPIHEQMSEWRENAPRYGPASGTPKLMGGPFVDTMNDFGMFLVRLANQQGDEAIESAKHGISNFIVPAFVRRGYDMATGGSTDLQTLAGFAEYKRGGGGANNAPSPYGGYGSY